MNMYLVTLVDGGFDCMYVLMNKGEWDELGDDGDCESPVFDKFFNDNAPNEDRVFYCITDIFNYLKENKATLVQDCVLTQW